MLEGSGLRGATRWLGRWQVEVPIRQGRGVAENLMYVFGLKEVEALVDLLERLPGSHEFQQLLGAEPEARMLGCPPSFPGSTVSRSKPGTVLVMASIYVRSVGCPAEVQSAQALRPEESERDDVDAVVSGVGQ